MLRKLRFLIVPLLFAVAPNAHAGDNPAHKTHPAAAHVRLEAEGAGDAAEKADSPSRKRPSLHGTVNLNQADEATLELLPSVGEKKAARILAYRKSHPFKRVEDLTKVRGFGKKTLSHLRPYLTITGPSTLGEEEAAASKSQ